MAEATFMITRYTISLGHKMYDYIDEHGINTQGKLECFGKHGYRLIIYFLIDTERALKPFYKEHEKYGAIFLPFSDMPAYVDLVRNEKPVFAYLTSDDPFKSNMIFSRPEPVGEEES